MTEMTEMTEMYKDNKDRNRDIMSIMIKNKTQYSKAYYGTEASSTNIVTDMDRFPYPRWYRGVADSDKPVIIEREAGYHMILREKAKTKDKSEKPKHVFTSACSTVLPIYSKENPSDLVVSQFCIDKFQ